MSVIDERVVVSYDDAVKRIGDGERIHVFRNPAAGMLLGCDWERSSLLDAMAKYEVSETGPQAASQGHPLCFWNDGWHFIQAELSEGQKQELEGINKAEGRDA